MTEFLHHWGASAMTTLGFFWMALWAFSLGYVISAMIQVFITKRRMQRTMGEAGPRSVALGVFFGFISSSCSFAALSTSRSLFQKGAGLVPALAFLLASTNLVIELGIIIFIFLSWHFVVGEYLGGILLILVMWLVVKLTLPKGLEQQAREHARKLAGEGHKDSGDEEDDMPDPVQRIKSVHGWRKVGRRYFMEWQMVWKDVTFGFTVAGIIAAFVPPGFFQTLFLGSGSEADPAWWQIILHTLIGPLAAFFTFIGSMGNIPLASILFASGVSFAGVMAFIFSDLVVFPVLRISAQYFGWKMAAYILGVFLLCLVVTSLVLHYGFSLVGMIPDTGAVRADQTRPGERFALDYTFFLNLAFLTLSLGFAYLAFVRGHDHEHGHDGHDHGGGRSWIDWLLLVLACGSLLWLAVGVVLWFTLDGG